MFVGSSVEMSDPNALLIFCASVGDCLTRFLMFSPSARCCVESDIGVTYQSLYPIISLMYPCGSVSLVQ